VVFVNIKVVPLSPLVPRHFVTPQRDLVSTSNDSLPHPRPQQPLIYFSLCGLANLGHFIEIESNKQYMAFYFCLLSLITVPSGFILVTCIDTFFFFHGQIVFHYRNVSHLSIHPSVDDWIFALFPSFSYKYKCYEHLCINFCVNISFQFFFFFLPFWSLNSGLHPC
jgi:hypothetical protein